MAKGKHSTALFEVIHSGKRPGRVAQSLRTPKWWFKGRPQSTTPPTPASASSDEEPQRVEEEREEPVEHPAVTRMRPSRGERSSRVQLGFDRGNQELTFKLRYTTVLVTAFSVCALVGLSYVVGRHLGGPKVASAEQANIKDLLQQPAQPDVTKVTKPRTQSQSSAPRAATPSTTTPDRGNSTALANNSVAPKQRVTTSLVPASADTSSPRKPGLNYLVIGTFPEDRKASAEQARDFFTKNGIPCTIEKKTDGRWESG